MSISAPSKTFTRDEVKSQGNSEDSVWFIVDSIVYDVSDFLDAHPGGEAVLRQVAGTDATAAFYNLHRHEVLARYADMAIGSIAGEKQSVVARAAGELSRVPYAEPLWLNPAFKSPYFRDSHKRLQKAIRKFTDEVALPVALEHEASGEYMPQSLIDKFAENGVTHMRLGPGPHLHGKELLGGGVIDGKEFDYFHDMVVSQEMARMGTRGFMDGMLAGLVIGLTVVRDYCNDKEMRARIMEECLTGKKKICLAITEAFAGSDVARLRTTAERTPDGKHFIVNGTKKWITNGVFSDYFITAVRTKTGRKDKRGNDEEGLSVLLIERGEGVETKPIKTSYSASAGTTFITFDNVKVPVNNLMGKEHKGIYTILPNFNHERWAMTCASISYSRVVVEESLKWAHQRLVFGQRLIDQAVIRQKLARMISLVESHQAWLESITYQMCNMTHAQQARELAGPIGLLKMSATKAAHEIAGEAVQIWGGRGLTASGMGRVIENFNRTVKFDAILGGAEEVLGDLGVRQAMRTMPKAML